MSSFCCELFALVTFFILQYNIMIGFKENSTDTTINNKFIITCKGDSIFDTLEESIDTINDSVLKHKIRLNIEDIKEVLLIIRCPPPRESYASLLKQHNVDPSSFRVLVLEWYEDIPKIQLHADHFQGLSIEQLHIYLPTGREPVTYLMPNFSEPLTSLSKLSVNGLVIPTMSNLSNIKFINWVEGVSKGPFGGCDRLRDVSLHYWEAQTVGWLAACSSIFYLELNYMSIHSITRTLHGVTSVQGLIISHSDLDGFDMKFFNLMPNLWYVVLKDNNIREIPVIQSPLPSLEVLDIVDNKLVDGYPIIKLLYYAPKLRRLDLTGNPSFKLCYTEFKKYGFLPFRIPSKSVKHFHLTELLLEKTNTSYITCLKLEGMPSLRLLKLPNIHPTYLKFQDFLLSNAPLQVHLPTKLPSNFFTIYDYETLSSTNRFNVTLHGLELDCDCQNGYLMKAIKNQILRAPNARCIELGEIIRIEDELLSHSSECVKTQCESCTCRHMWSDLSVVAICNYRNATRIPRVQNLTKLIAPYNLISNLDVEDIPESLTFLDLTGNGISYINKNVTKELFSVKQRHLLLAENPIVCDCKNYDFIQTLQDNHEQIDDYNDLTCSDNKTVFLRTITKELLCPLAKEILVAEYTTIIISLACVMFMTVLSVILHNRYGREIRIYLYARGLCLCCIKEDKLDADKEYDAFVSFSFEDDALVSQEFLPRLEEFGYKVCVHYRDWIPGDVIPAQIVKSVASSRRTIIMLSRHFINSTWGLMEFQTAHKKALRDNILRVIVVVLDDVLDTSEVDTNLREYLCSNTYIRYDDSWFWDRLRYALPQPRNQPTVPPLIPLQPITNT